MPQNSSSQKNIIIVVVLVVVIAAGYLFLSPSEGGSEDASSVDQTLFTPEVRAYYAAKDKINFKDLSFMKKEFYKELRDDTVDIPSVEPTGRPNPFVPYVTP